MKKFFKKLKNNLSKESSKELCQKILQKICSTKTSKNLKEPQIMGIWKPVFFSFYNDSSQKFKAALALFQSTMDIHPGVWEKYIPGPCIMQFLGLG